MAPEDCTPGRRVAYIAYPDAPVETGTIHRHTSLGAFVVYDGETTAKLTPYNRLLAETPDVVWPA